PSYLLSLHDALPISYFFAVLSSRSRNIVLIWAISTRCLRKAAGFSTTSVTLRKRRLNRPLMSVSSSLWSSSSGFPRSSSRRLAFLAMAAAHHLAAERHFVRHVRKQSAREILGHARDFVKDRARVD